MYADCRKGPAPIRTQRAGAPDPEEVGHALEREDRDSGEPDEQEVLVLPEIRVGEVQDVVEEPGRGRPEDDVARGGRPGEPLQCGLEPSMSKSSGSPKGSGSDRE